MEKESYADWCIQRGRYSYNQSREEAFRDGKESRQAEIDELKSKLKAINEFQNKIYDEIVLFNPDWELVFNKLESIEDLSKGELDEE